MEFNEKLLQDTKKLMIHRYPRFASEVASVGMEYKTDLPYHTAATDGKNIYFDPDYIESLTNDERLFIIAHELMHVKFQHMLRMVDSNGNRRDPMLWNIATDAIINANLVRDGFKIKEGYIDMPEALNYSAEEFYQKLLSEQEQQKNNQQNANGEDGDNKEQQTNGNGQQNSSNKQEDGNSNENANQSNETGGTNQSDSSSNGSGVNKDTDSTRQHADDHSLWEKAFEDSLQKQDKPKDKDNFQDGGQNKNGDEQEQEEKSQNGKDKSKSSNKGGIGDGKMRTQEIRDLESSEIIEREAKFDEKDEFQKNREERLQRAKESMQKTKDEQLKKSQDMSSKFGSLGEEKPVLDWRLLLKREVDKNVTVWSQRKSIAENNYAYRLEEYEVDDESETEVMIDVSGSVSDEMVKSFLRQLKPILKNSKLKVGFFADYATKEFIEIKKDKDIDCIRVKRPGYGTNMDSAVRAFSKKRETNKIVFTDGYPGTMPKDDLKGTNVIWLVYENRDFHPCCGRVIDVYPKNLQIKNNIIRNKNGEDLGR